MPSIPPSMTRVAYISTDYTGGSLDLMCPEGMLQARRADPGGVLLQIGGVKLSIQKADLPAVGRFFLAAALMLGEPINEGWDGPQA